MNLNTIGEILRFYREKYNFKQSDVCNGICSISTLSRIENGNKAADSLILECLLGRIGKEVLQFEMILNDYDYSLWMVRKNDEVISLSREVQSYENGTFRGVILINLNMNKITEICNSFQEKQENFICIINYKYWKIYQWKRNVKWVLKL